MSLELLPTKENIIMTLQENSVGRNESLYSFLKLLFELQGPKSIAVDGYWGSGKTFFVKQAEFVINAENKYLEHTTSNERNVVESCFNEIDSGKRLSEYHPQVAVYYDSWANDNDTDPILSIVYSIIQSIDTNYTLEKSRDLFDIAASIGECVTGRGILNVFEKIKGDDPLAVIREQHNLGDLIREFLTDIIRERGNRLVIFIDELDRCRPQYAVQLLERVKHYFGMEDVTFVFSINLQELQHTVKKLYGNDFNAVRYLDRFFDLRVSLPEANKKRYCEKNGFGSTNLDYDNNCHRVMKYCQLELREMMRFTSAANAAISTLIDRNHRFIFGIENATKINVIYILPLMIGLRMTNLTLYNQFVSGNDFSPLKELLMSDEIYKDCLIPLLSNENSFFDNDEKGMRDVAEKTIQDWYDAIFVKQYDNRTYDYTVGNIRFEKKNRDELFELIGLLSLHTSFDI